MIWVWGSELADVAFLGGPLWNLLRARGRPRPGRRPASLNKHNFLSRNSFFANSTALESRTSIFSSSKRAFAICAFFCRCGLKPQMWVRKAKTAPLFKLGPTLVIHCNLGAAQKFKWPISRVRELYRLSPASKLLD